MTPDKAGAVPAAPQYVLVPVEPTPEMIAAFAKEWHKPFVSTMKTAMAAMLAAAPKAAPAVPKPIAWRYVPSDVWRDHIITEDPEQAAEAVRLGREVTPLYAAAPTVAPAEPQSDELRIARGAIRELEAKVFSQEQALAVLRGSVASYMRDMADPPGYLQDAVIKASGLGAMAEEIAALKRAQTAPTVAQPLTETRVREVALSEIAAWQADYKHSPELLSGAELNAAEAAITDLCCRLGVKLGGAHD